MGNTRVAFQADEATTFTTVTVYCGDYYAYGKILREYDAGDGDRYLTTMHERDRETGLDYRGARYYDSDVARFLSTDPWASKYPAWSTYCYVKGNPIAYIDPNGKGPTDWFVNKTSGTIIYIKGASEVTQEVLDKMGSKFSPEDYERLGPDNMFGDYIEWPVHSGKNFLNHEYYGFGMLSYTFMSLQGYEKSQRVLVREKKFESGGRMDNNENVTSTTYSIEEVGDRTYTWAKRSGWKKIENPRMTTDEGPYSSITTVTYKTVVRAGAKIRSVMYFGSQRTGDTVAESAEIANEVLSIIKELAK